MASHSCTVFKIYLVSRHYEATGTRFTFYFIKQKTRWYIRNNSLHKLDNKRRKYPWEKRYKWDEPYHCHMYCLEAVFRQLPCVETDSKDLMKEPGRLERVRHNTREKWPSQGESNLQFLRWEEESLQAFGWVLICACIPGGYLCPGKELPDSKRANNSQSLQRAWNSFCPYLIDTWNWLDHFEVYFKGFYRVHLKQTSIELF